MIKSKNKITATDVVDKTKKPPIHTRTAKSSSARTGRTSNEPKSAMEQLAILPCTLISMQHGRQEHAEGDTTHAADATDTGESANVETKSNAPESLNQLSSVSFLPKAASKQSLLITLLQNPAGVTIAELATAIGWQQHSVQGVMSGVLKKKLGFSITSSREVQGRVYRIVDTKIGV